MSQKAHTRREAPVVGLLGGIGAGKSTVAAMLAARGAAVVDADRAAREKLDLEEVKAALTAAFGPDILDARGAVDRARLAQAAFATPEGVAQLNRITHPAIIGELAARVVELRADGRAPLIVLDAPLLVETGLHEQLCDMLVYVEAPEGLRRNRAAGRGVGPEQFAKRAQAQTSDARKRALTDYAVVNDGSIEDLRRRVDELWPALCRRDTACALRTPPA